MDIKIAKIAQAKAIPVITNHKSKFDWMKEGQTYTIRQINRAWNKFEKEYELSAVLANEGRAVYTVPLDLVEVADHPAYKSMVKAFAKQQAKQSERKYIQGLFKTLGTKKAVLEYIGDMVDEAKATQRANGEKCQVADRNPIYQEVISYLNSVAGTKFRASAKTYKYAVDKRLNDGFDVEDFKTVIDNKFKDWKGTEMMKYMRPETLFGSKFESYLNEKPVADKNKIQGKASYDINELQQQAMFNDDFGI